MTHFQLLGCQNYTNCQLVDLLPDHHSVCMLSSGKQMLLFALSNLLFIQDVNFVHLFCSTLLSFTFRDAFPMPPLQSAKLSITLLLCWLSTRDKQHGNALVKSPISNCFLVQIVAKNSLRSFFKGFINTEYFSIHGALLIVSVKDRKPKCG